MVFQLDEQFNTVAKMKVIGVGGAGGNAINRMVDAGLAGVEFISVNTDAMALEHNRSPNRIQIGERITKGLGAGANPDIGRQAMEEDRDKIALALEGADMVFITGGMGGGTGTGGAPVIAEIAREMGILTVAIVTKPFLFEGKVRDKNAKRGLEDLNKFIDTIITIPNQKLLTIVDNKTTLIDAFKTADDVLYQATKGISDLIAVHGLVNLDFADVKTIMRSMGEALMGTGCAEGDTDKRAINAAEAAIHNPLLDDISISGARGILINVTGGTDMTLYDVSEATRVVNEAVGAETETNTIFGAVTDATMNGKIRVTVIATGFNEASIAKKREERASKFEVNIPGLKKEAEKPVEQINIPFSFPKKPEKAAETEPVDEVAQMRAASTVKIAPKPDSPVEESLQPATVEAAAATASSPVGEFPPFLKQEAMRREPRVYVSKGSVLTQYEDDMDVPTFLRKQMQ
jgi:cell division protein FtsZ